MKLILTIIRDSDTEPISQALVQEGYRVTRISTTGGFLHRGSTTLMIGTDDDKVDLAIDILRNNLGLVTDPDIHRAIIFVLPVEHFIQM